MITRIREVRRARGLTLQDVADRCTPPTTAQTIGRLETGMRTVSVGWLNRIAGALDVGTADLVKLADDSDLPVAALLTGDGVAAPRHGHRIVPPRPAPGSLAILVETSVGDYRHGDIVWAERLEPQSFGAALNRDVLVPKPAGRFGFGRLIDRDGSRLHILPPGHGARQQIIQDAPWLAVATRLVRSLG